MNCYLHPDTPSIAFCRSCGRPLCGLCQRSADGTIYCQDHVPVAPHANPAEPNTAGAPNPYFQPAPGPGAARVQTSPGLAFVLGWIPGVGAIYNGQYLKGLVHAIIFGLLISLANSAEGTSGQPLLIMMMCAFIFYMPFEAYHTAKKRQLGVPIDEWSSLMGQPRYTSRAPIGPILLIGIGVLFLLDTLHLVQFRDIGRFWPVLLIAVGAYMLYTRVTSGGRKSAAPPYTPPARDPSNDFLGTRHE